MRWKGCRLEPALAEACGMEALAGMGIAMEGVKLEVRNLARLCEPCLYSGNGISVVAEVWWK